MKVHLSLPTEVYKINHGNLANAFLLNILAGKQANVRKKHIFKGTQLQVISIYPLP